MFSSFIDVFFVPLMLTLRGLFLERLKLILQWKHELNSTDLNNMTLDMQNWLFLLSNAVMDKMIIYVFYTFVEQYWLNDSKMDVNINSKMPYLVFHMKGYEGSYHCRNQRHGETLKKLHLIVIHCGFKLH